MKIIFLDFDGVLNHELWYRQSKENDSNYEKSQFDPHSVELLNLLTDSTGAKIVVSSSWRQGRTLEELQELLDSVGVTGEVIGKTPKLYYSNYDEYPYSVPRGCEIKAWLEMNKGILGDKISRAKYVILDDDSDMLYWQRNHFLQVDSYCGITSNIVRKAQKILND